MKFLFALIVALVGFSAHAQNPLSNLVCASSSVPSPGDFAIPGPAHRDWMCSISTSLPGSVPTAGGLWSNLNPSAIAEFNPLGCAGGATNCIRYHCNPNAPDLQPTYVNGVLSQTTKGYTVRFTTWDKRDRPYTKQTTVVCSGPIPDPNSAEVWLYIEDTNPTVYYYCHFPYILGGWCGPYWFPPYWG